MEFAQQEVEKLYLYILGDVMNSFCSVIWIWSQLWPPSVPPFVALGYSAEKRACEKVMSLNSILYQGSEWELESPPSAAANSFFWEVFLKYKISISAFTFEYLFTEWPTIMLLWHNEKDITLSLMWPSFTWIDNMWEAVKMKK